VRVLVEIVLPQVAQTLLVGLVLSIVTMLSVLSVPMMVSGSQPTMLTVDMAFRINSYGDYATANALGVISYAMTAVRRLDLSAPSGEAGGRVRAIAPHPAPRDRPRHGSRFRRRCPS